MWWFCCPLLLRFTRSAAHSAPRCLASEYLGAILGPSLEPGLFSCGTTGWLSSEGLNKSHDGQPSGTSGFDPNHELDCPVPRLTLLFFGAAKDVPEAAKMVTAGTACLHLDQQANGQTGHCFQAALRPLKKCITKEITAMISKR